ncbi:MAG: calcium/sodium antiporter [Lachnospiraceae bacterium]|nr:calcium/sodium antiporter [Lachnospiraceae bacterium]
MLVPILLFLLGFVCLIKGGDWFVDGASDIARRLKIPEIIVGATIVSIGTTLPEVMVSATSAVTGHGEIAYGNAIGSIICNTALISALTIAIRPSLVKRKTFILPVIFFFGAAVFYSLIAYLTGYFSRTVGIILVAIFVVYIVLITLRSRKHPDEIEEEEETVKELPLWKTIVFLIVGAALIAVGARLLVDNGTIIATKLGVPESVVALTFVALGTSLPELVTAITSLIKGHSALSIGNIVGANLFNLVLVCGVSTTLSPFAVPASKTIAGMNSSLVVDIPLMLLVMVIMTVPALIRQKLSRVQGILLLLIYAAFVVYQFVF